MQTDCELNVTDLVTPGHSGRAIATKISVSSLWCARLSMMQLSGHASSLPILSSTSKHDTGIEISD